MLLLYPTVFPEWCNVTVFVEVAWDLKDKNIYLAQSSLKKIQLSCIMGNVGFTILDIDLQGDSNQV